MTAPLTDERPLSDFGTEDEFEQVFRRYFKPLHAYACTLLRDPVAAEEMVQTIFLRLWEKRGDLEIRQKLSSYLYRAVHNESMNHLKQGKRRSIFQSYAMRQQTQTPNTETSGKLSLRELEGRLQKALNELPEQCRTIFQL